MMQWVDDAQSIYGRRLVCRGEDIDEAMEARYLRFFNGACNVDKPAIDIEQFIDTLIKEHIDYDPQASDLPFSVLGATKFQADGSRLVQVNPRHFSKDDPAVKGRFRFTCAHEVFHALYHAPLFSRGGHLKCYTNQIREDMSEPATNSKDYTEWQANRGAAALLMPSSIFKEVVKRSKLNTSDNLDALIRRLAVLFNVSRQSVRIRLQTLRMIATPEDDIVLQYNGIDDFRDTRDRKWY